jgi:predicted GNAT superfamily acetyltransferase
MPLITADDLVQATRIYREVFGYNDPSYAVSPRLLSALLANGGSVVGARQPSGELVAFAYGFVGIDGEQIYHYSQAAVVAMRYRNQGLGRALKRCQREVALGHGQSRMRWAYDPAMVGAGHFNLDVLGAVGRWYRRDFYGVPGTDRVIVDWDLMSAQAGSDATPRPPLSRPDLERPAGWLRPRVSNDEVWLPLPVELPVAAARLSRSEIDLRRDIHRAVGELIDAGYAATSCIRLSPESAAYQFTQTYDR